MTEEEAASQPPPPPPRLLKKDEARRESLVSRLSDCELLDCGEQPPSLADYVDDWDANVSTLLARQEPPLERAPVAADGHCMFAAVDVANGGSGGPDCISEARKRTATGLREINNTLVLSPFLDINVLVPPRHRKPHATNFTDIRAALQERADLHDSIDCMTPCLTMRYAWGAAIDLRAHSLAVGKRDSYGALARFSFPLPVSTMNNCSSQEMVILSCLTLADAAL